MNSEYAKVIADSISPRGRRIVSIEVKYWRCIHAELMTHRAFARNAASSRAIPVRKTFEIVKTDPFIPEFIGMEQKGMQAGQELDESSSLEAEHIINDMRVYCLRRCEELAVLQVHKSIVNRYLEPWSYITVLITATNWRNFFRLRVHEAAEKHFQKVAKLIESAIHDSVPQETPVNGWHLPYIRDEDWGSGEDLVKVSAGRSARLSYLTQDGRRDLGEDIGLHDRLVSNEPKHSSALEHPCMCLENPNQHSGVMLGWMPYRMTIPNESVLEDVL